MVSGILLPVPLGQVPLAPAFVPGWFQATTHERHLASRVTAMHGQRKDAGRLALSPAELPGWVGRAATVPRHLGEDMACSLPEGRFP